MIPVTCLRGKADPSSGIRMETRIILISSKSTFAFPLTKVCCVVRGRSESLFIINSYHESYLPLAFIIPLWLPYRPVAPLLSLSNIPFPKRASCKSGLIRYSARYRKLSDYPPAVSINQPLFIPPSLLFSSFLPGISPYLSALSGEWIQIRLPTWPLSSSIRTSSGWMYGSLRCCFSWLFSPSRSSFRAVASWVYQLYFHFSFKKLPWWIFFSAGKAFYHIQFVFYLISPTLYAVDNLWYAVDRAWYLSTLLPFDSNRATFKCIARAVYVASVGPFYPCWVISLVVDSRFLFRRNPGI